MFPSLTAAAFCLIYKLGSNLNLCSVLSLYYIFFPELLRILSVCEQFRVYWSAYWIFFTQIRRLCPSLPNQHHGFDLFLIYTDSPNFQALRLPSLLLTSEGNQAEILDLNRKVEHFADTMFLSAENLYKFV